jgi:membrane protein DedA with SNARE-associated domain
MDHWVAEVIAFITANRAWAGPIVFVLAFSESLAFLSLIVPFTAIIVSAGALVGAGTLDPWIVVPWGIAGAAFGDAVSFWVGRYFGDAVPRMWPFRNDPEHLARGQRFFHKWGVLSVFIGRFFGPLRAVVPVVAGMMRMPQGKFQIANVVSAIIWLPALLLPGAIAGNVFKDVTGFGEKAFGYVFIVFLIIPLAAGLFVWLRKRRKP